LSYGYRIYGHDRTSFTKNKM